MIPSLTTKHFDGKVPLYFDTIYYVESPDNQALNWAVRKLQQEGTVYSNSKMQPFPFRIQYLEQNELDANHLSQMLGEGYNPEIMEKAVADMRQCLSADQGGTLSARCLPVFPTESTYEDDHTIFCITDFNATTPEKVRNCILDFAMRVADENNKRLSQAFPSFQDKSEDSLFRDLYLPLDIDFERIPDFETSPLNRSRTKTKQEFRLSDLPDIIDIYTSRNGIDPLEWVKEEVKRRENEGKPKKLYPIVVENNKIYIQYSEKEHQEIRFRRGNVARTIYIFFLRQLMHAQNDPSVPKYLSQVEVENDYLDELFEIYQNVSSRTRIEKSKVESWFRKDVNPNDFVNAISSINKDFNKLFDIKQIKTDYKKSYCIESSLGKDKYLNPRYGILLAPDDFVLSWPFDIE